MRPHRCQWILVTPPIHYSNPCARGWEDSSGEVRVLTTPQLMDILATRMGTSLGLSAFYSSTPRAIFFLTQQLDNESIVMLHRRASQWYEQQGQADATVVHAVYIHDWHYAVDLIEPVARRQHWMWKNEAFVHRWIEQLPPEVTQSHPLLSLVYALLKNSSNRINSLRL